MEVLICCATGVYHYFLETLNFFILAIALYLTMQLLPMVSAAFNFGQRQYFRRSQHKPSSAIPDPQRMLLALQDSENRLGSIFQAAAIGIAIINREGRVLEANPAYDLMMGHNLPGTTHRENSSFIAAPLPDDLVSTETVIEDLFTKKYASYSYTKRYIRPDQSNLWVNIQMTLMEPETPGSEPYAIALLENITQHKQTEQALIKTQEQLKNLLQARTDQISQMNEELSWQSSHDALTGLLNRYAFERQLSTTLRTLRKNPKIAEHTLCYLNLDRFKAINELGGSLAGDEILRQVSRIIESRCRQTDLIARLGADEFVLLLRQCPLEQAMKVAQSIVERVQNSRFQWEDREYSVSASIGLVPLNQSVGEQTQELLMAADAACFAAKKQGRSRIRIYEATDQELIKYRSEAQWISKIEKSLEENSFVLYAQPIIEMQGETMPIRHWEVLIRMAGENGEIISSGSFLPAAERYHLVTKIDFWVIERMLQYLTQRCAQGAREEVWSINLSGASINDEALLGFLQEQFERYPVPTNMICFEVTETVAIANLNRAKEVIHGIRAIGCQISLDDFGAGMSSFSYLKYLPVDYLKIDGSFVKDMVSDPVDYAMVETINRIGHVMGIQTVAEYVGDQEIAEAIRHIGIDYGQGFGLAKPAPLPALWTEEG
jgi:diguanylate cyclase (GGDEF)-like protein/PAS domain S-box-containing protein